MKKMDDRTKEALEKMKKELEKEDKNITGGLIVPISQCCGVPLRQTIGGMIMDYCPKCGRMH